MGKTDEIGIIQFGEGNFLRCFVDWMIHRLRNEGLYHKKVALVQPIEHGRVEELKSREGKYHCILQGVKDGESVTEIETIDVFETFTNPYQDFGSYLELATHPSLEVIVSNTTEAGIQFIETDKADETPPSSFPAKLTLLLKERFEAFPEKEIHIVPCELIENNGGRLKECVLSYIHLWNLDENFKTWIEDKVHFYNTLVDRIVPGHPKDSDNEELRKLGASDPFATIGEYFHQWVIENGERLESILPLRKAGLNVIYTENLKPYRDRKVRVLNGAHTAMVSVGIRKGIETVGDFMKDKSMRDFLETMMREEIAPTIQQAPKDVQIYVDNIIERFENPFIQHRLSDISLNSVSKFKTRLLPSYLDFVRLKKEVPEGINLALASLIESIQLNENPSAFRDDPKVIELVKSEKVGDLLQNENLWGVDMAAHSMSK
jgi:tagaturonate reductase